MVSNKHVFWQAFVMAVFLFGIGIVFGFYIEGLRTASVERNLLLSEVNILDSQIVGQLSDNFDFSCNVERENLISFADEIYAEARQLEDYDDSAQLSDVLEVIHRKYDLLRVMLWMQSIDFKERCGLEFHTAVYIYDYKSPTPLQRSEQITFSRVLENLKEKYGNDFILIPIAGDLEISSIELIKDGYGISKLPVVIIDENILISSIDDVAKIEEELF